MEALHRVACARIRLESVQKCLFPRQNELVVKERQCMHEYVSIRGAEEAFMNQ